jgi:rfaE bifunctional protein kinase chain/domain
MPDALPSREDAARTRVLVVGDTMLDRYWFGAVDRISPEAPVPVVRIEREELRLGGAANVARNVAGLGARATLLTVLGRDEPARLLEGLLDRAGIHTRAARDPHVPTTVKLRVIGRSQQLVRVDFEQPPDGAVLAGLVPDHAALVGQADVVLFSDYGKGALAQVQTMLEAARAAGRPVLVDPKGRDWARYRGATVLTPNRGELSQVVGAWSGEAGLREKAQRLRAELAIDTLLLTRSEEGMSLFDADGEAHVPAHAREVFDVTGAGDTVVATMAVLLAAGLTPRQAMPHANRAGGIAVGRFGTASVGWEELFG